MCALVGCVSVNTTKQNIAVYDFGLSGSNEGHQVITAKLLLEATVAAESLNQNKIRYRLGYQNPSRIYYYAQSRWATTPSELFSSKLNKMVNFTKTPTSCSLKLRIEAFDQIFHSATTSDGVVQLSAIVVERKSQKIISNQFITESVPALSANSEGGAVALQIASENALKQAINWGNMIADNNALCQ
jgi:ABC-type uncharacterized transport system auxiliary subunit